MARSTQGSGPLPDHAEVRRALDDGPGDGCWFDHVGGAPPFGAIVSATTLAMPEAEPEPARPPDTSHTRRLIREVQSGRPDSFTELYTHLAPTLCAWTTMRARTVLRGRIEVEDLMQETWYRAHRGFARFDAGAIPFRAWLLGIAKNVLLEAFRKARVQGKVQSEEGETERAALLANVPESVTSLTRRVARDDSMREFVAWVDTLPVEEKELVVGCGLEGQSCVVIATRLGLSDETVTKRWQRLRARMRENDSRLRLLADE